jgi:MarR family transcriptional regulator, lower aerobic nicotinate degradation pathway regulator
MATLPTTEDPIRPIHRVAKELVASSGFLLARLGIGFKTKAIARMEEVGCELYDYSVLAILAEGSRETQGTIADALSVDPSRLVALLDRLEERSLIVRQRDPLDRRRHVVSITPAGKRQLGRLRELIRQLEDDFFAAFDAEERKALHGLLLRLAEANDPRCAFKVEPVAVVSKPKPPV